MLKALGGKKKMVEMKEVAWAYSSPCEDALMCSYPYDLMSFV